MLEDTVKTVTINHATPVQIYLQGSLFSLYRSNGSHPFSFNEHAGRPLSLNDCDPGFKMLWNTILDDPSFLVKALVEHERKLERLYQKISDAVDNSFDSDRYPYWSTSPKKKITPSHSERKLKRAVGRMLESYIDSVLLKSDWKIYLNKLVDDGVSNGLSYQGLLRDLDDRISQLESFTNLQIVYLRDTWVWKILVKDEDEELYKWYSGGFSAVEQPQITYPTYHFAISSDLIDECGVYLRIKPTDKTLEVSPSTVYMLGELCDLSPGFESAGHLFNKIVGRQLEKVRRDQVDSDDLFVDLWNMLSSTPGQFKDYLGMLISGINKFKNQITLFEGLWGDSACVAFIDALSLPGIWKKYLIADVEKMVRDHDLALKAGFPADFIGRLLFSLSDLGHRLYWISNVSKRGEACVSSVNDKLG